MGITISLYSYNQAYYNLGYADGLKNQKTNGTIKYIYHHHTNACGPRVCTIQVNYAGTFPHPADPNVMIAEVHTVHNACGKGTRIEYKTPGVPSGYTSTHSYYVYCNKSEGQLEGATIIWN